MPSAPRPGPCKGERPSHDFLAVRLNDRSITAQLLAGFPITHGLRGGGMSPLRMSLESGAHLPALTLPDVTPACWGGRLPGAANRKRSKGGKRGRGQRARPRRSWIQLLPAWRGRNPAWGTTAQPGGMAALSKRFVLRVTLQGGSINSGRTSDGDSSLKPLSCVFCVQRWRVEAEAADSALTFSAP